MKTEDIKVLKVEDGDTFKVENRSGSTYWLRFPNLDTHETSTKRGDKEKTWALGWVQSGRESYSGNEYPFVAYTTLDQFEKGSYGRKLAKVYRKSDGDDFETSILTEFDEVGWREKDNKAKKQQKPC